MASGEHEEFLRKLGADGFIDYTKDRPEDVAHDVDLVLDTVGGPDNRRLLRVLKRGGALFPVYFAEYDPEEVADLGITTSLTQVRSTARANRAPDAGGDGTCRHRQHLLTRRRPTGPRTRSSRTHPGQDHPHGPRSLTPMSYARTREKTNSGTP